MPPLKRFRDMEHLSGGEKTIAALALLFAIHSWHPSPFFVLDEVDAALDNANVARIARYIRGHARPGMQFIVISLKNVLFQMSETLVGIYRDQGANSSKSLTLDVSFSPSHQYIVFALACQICLLFSCSCESTDKEPWMASNGNRVFLYIGVNSLLFDLGLQLGGFMYIYRLWDYSKEGLFSNYVNITTMTL